MANRHKTPEAKNAELAGKIFHGITILKVLRNEPLEGSTSPRWFVLAKCVCGREYTSLLSTIKHNQKPSCGCRNVIKGRGVSRKYDGVDVRPEGVKRLRHCGS